MSSLLEQAKNDNLTDLEILHRLCDEERASCMKSAVDRRIKDAKFPELNTVDGFDFDFDPVRKKLRARYLALHDLSFLDKGINPLFIGIPGTGKTFLARALAYRACHATRRVVFTTATRMLNDLDGAEIHGQLERALRRYCRADFLVIDDSLTASALPVTTRDMPSRPPTVAASLLGPVRVTADGLNVRRTPHVGQHNIIGGLHHGAVVAPLGREGEWLRIEYRGDVGFIHGGFVEPLQRGRDPRRRSAGADRPLPAGRGVAPAASRHGDRDDVASQRSAQYLLAELGNHQRSFGI